MVKVERSQPAPSSLAVERDKKNGKYNEPDVIRRLVKDFHGKCYICEIHVKDVNVEHLIPHKGGKYPDREFDWDNLFLSCPHCNKVKSQAKYDDGIVDCCREDPEQLMAFGLEDDRVVVRVFDASDERAKRTAGLVEEVFHTTNTGSLTYESEVRLNDLQREMNVLYGQLAAHVARPGDRVVTRTLRGLLKRESEFAGFKRSYVRLHRADYPDLFQMATE